MSRIEGAESKRSPGVDVAGSVNRLLANIEKVILGKRPQITLCLVAYLCEGHILLEDVPGVAKTMLGRALARSVGCTFKRLQCTPDLLPTDVTGVSIFNQKTAEFEFRPGPIFSQTLLADEINRTTPRTQSALLEAMAERRVSVDGQTYTLKPPFLVIATQNPVDHEGTFPAAAPEALLSTRFLIRLSLGYPSIEEEGKMLGRLQHGHPIEDIDPVVTASEWVACQDAVREIHVDDKVRRYVLEIVHGTRMHDDIHLGGSLALRLLCSRTSAGCLAAIQGRRFSFCPTTSNAWFSRCWVIGSFYAPESRLRKVTAASLLHEIVSDQRKVPVAHRDNERRTDFADD